MEREVGDDAVVAAGRHGAVRADDGADGVWNTAGNGFYGEGHTGAVILLVLRSGHIRASGTGFPSGSGRTGSGGCAGCRGNRLTGCWGCGLAGSWGCGLAGSGGRLLHIDGIHYGIVEVTSEPCHISLVLDQNALSTIGCHYGIYTVPMRMLQGVEGEQPAVDTEETVLVY